jgi:malate synthase
MTERVVVEGLSVAKVLHEFIRSEVLPGTGVPEAGFWTRLDRIVHDLAPKNGALLQKRDALQARIDEWHCARRGQPLDRAAYRAFLAEIGYLVPEGPDFTIDTDNVDPEMAHIAGPQLVVPVTNARYALNAANARWGSLYDALYGTDALPEDDGAARGSGYNPVRGSRVFAWTKRFLDEVAPLGGASHAQVRGYALQDGRLVASLGSVADTWLHSAARMIGLESAARVVGLANPSQFAGYRGDPAEPRAVLLRHNGLHIEIQIDSRHYIGKGDIAGVADVLIEAAVTTIVDLEDSIAAVDPDDKVAAYRNWRAPAQSGSGLRHARRGRRADPARPQPAAGAQRRTPDDGRVRARPRREAGAGGHSRCGHCIARRHARPQWPRRLPQQSHRVDLHRQAEDARARGSRVLGRVVCASRGRAGPGAQHAQDGHHG